MLLPPGTTGNGLHGYSRINPVINIAAYAKSNNAQRTYSQGHLSIETCRKRRQRLVVMLDEHGLDNKQIVVKVLTKAMKTTAYVQAPIVVDICAPLAAAMNTKNFENIPANGGMPPRENKASVMIKLRRGLVW